MKHLAQELRSFLVDEGICRLPSDDEAEGKPCYCELAEGAPAPDDLEGAASDTAVVHISRAGGMPTPSLHGFYEVSRVEVIIRSTTAPEGEEVATMISDALSDRRCYELGNLHIEESLITIPLQRYPTVVEQHGYIWGVEISFMVRVANRAA